MGSPPLYACVCAGVSVYFSTRCAAKSCVSAATRGDFPGTPAANSSAQVRQMGHRISSRPKNRPPPRGRCAGITRLERGEERLDGDVDGKIVEFLSGGDWNCTS